MTRHQPPTEPTSPTADYQGEPEGAAPEDKPGAMCRANEGEAEGQGNTGGRTVGETPATGAILPDEVDGVVERLTKGRSVNEWVSEELAHEAAALIQRLTTENERLTERLNRAHLDCAKYLGELAVLRAALGENSRMWQDISTAPRDGTLIDLWVGNGRVPDAWWGRPNHSCGEFGPYCDCCPTRDDWCDAFGYVSGDDGAYAEPPTHWMLVPAPPSQGEQ